MSFVNARNRNAPQGQLTVYIIITGFDNACVGFDWHWKFPIAWLRAYFPDNRYKCTQIEYEGVKFEFFDTLPIKSNLFYQAIMRDVLMREGLQGS